MRLFTAITFNEDIKDSLFRAILKLKDNAVSGSFTAKDNLHLTLNFIGETGRLGDVKLAMDQMIGTPAAESFSMQLEGFGSFQRREGDICWIGVVKEPALWRLQEELNKKLIEAGFTMEARKFKPHLTLGRRVRLSDSSILKDLAQDLPPMKHEVEKINLMKSERIEGKLVYTEIYALDL